MTLTVRYPDREIRDGWVASGMTEGLGQGYDRLDEVLASSDVGCGELAPLSSISAGRVTQLWRPGTGGFVTARCASLLQPPEVRPCPH